MVFRERKRLGRSVNGKISYTYIQLAYTHSQESINAKYLPFKLIRNGELWFLNMLHLRNLNYISKTDLKPHELKEGKS